MTINIGKKQIISSLFWKFMENGSSQVVNFIVSIVLARLLSPNDYGTIALITIFINLSNVFIQAGFNTSLIQKKNTDELDYSTVFYVSLVLATILYCILFLMAPYIAKFYGQPILIKALRVISINLFFGALNSIQIAIISKKMQFKKLFYRSFGATTVSGILGVIMAYSGFGIWALVFQQILNQVISTVVMWFTLKWRPQFIFSFKRLRNLFSFGWKILISNLINTLFLNIRDIIIGRVYSSTILGYFNRGKQFPSLIITNIDGTIQSVMLPTYSAEQDDKERIKNMVEKSINISSFLIFPMMIGMYILAEPLVLILLTDKWLGCVPFLKIFSLTYMLIPLYTANLQAIQAIGRSDLILKIEVVKRSIETIILIISLKFGVYAIAIGTLVTGIIGIVLNSYHNYELLGYGYKEQLRDVFPSLLSAIVMGIIVNTIKYLRWNMIITFIVQILVGIITYIILSIIFKNRSYIYLLKTFRNFKSKKETRININD